MNDYLRQLFLYEHAAVHVIMLNAYDGYLPNNTLDVTVNGLSQVLLGNQGGPSFPTGNYPQVSPALETECIS